MSGGPYRGFLPQNLLARLERVTLLTRHRVRGTMQGKRRSGQLGSSLEFADYRPYSPGDDLRRLDWHAYGKTGRPYVKLYLDEQELQVSLYVDASASMGFVQGYGIGGTGEGVGERPAAGAGNDGHSAHSGFSSSGGFPPKGGVSANGGHPSKFRYACQLAACVAYASLCSYDRVGVQLFGEGITARLPMCRGKGSIFRVMDFLEQARLEQTGDIASVFMKPASLPTRPGVAWVFSDFLFSSGVEEAVKALLAAHQEVRLVQVLAPEELEPVLAGDLRLVDCETGAGKEVAVSAKVLQAYREAAAGYTHWLERFCREHGAGYDLALTSASLEETVLGSFRRAGMVQA